MSTNTVTKTNVVIINKRGLHARAAAKFVRLAAQYECDIIVARNDTEVPGRSLMGLLTLGASQGKDVDIICEGKDCDKALAALSDLIQRGFDEDDNDGS